MDHKPWFRTWQDHLFSDPRFMNLTLEAKGLLWICWGLTNRENGKKCRIDVANLSRWCNHFCNDSRDTTGSMLGSADHDPCFNVLVHELVDNEWIEFTDDGKSFISIGWDKWQEKAYRAYARKEQRKRVAEMSQDCRQNVALKRTRKEEEERGREIKTSPDGESAPPKLHETFRRKKTEQTYTEIGGWTLFLKMPGFAKAFYASANRWKKMYPGTLPVEVAQKAHDWAEHKKIVVENPIAFIEEFYGQHFKFKQDEKVRLAAIDRAADLNVKQRRTDGTQGRYENTNGVEPRPVGEILKNVIGDITKKGEL